MKDGFEKRFKQGDIVYFCENTQGHSDIKWGMVDEQFSDAVCVDFLETKENRYIDGIPLDEFRKNEINQHYKKLPKGWTYDTKLFTLEYINDSKDEELFEKLDVSIDKPESIKKAYELGLFVKSSDKFQGNIETDITRDWYKVITKYPMWKHKITHTSVRPDKCYFTYQEALKEKIEYEKEFQRQASLSDYDWSVEQIDKTLKFYQKLSDETDDKIQQYRNWLLEMKDVENIETRIHSNQIQWKYWKNKRWNNITL